MSVSAEFEKTPLKLSEVPMHVLRIIGMRLRIRSRSQTEETIPDRMLQILDDLDWRERFKRDGDEKPTPPE